MLRVRGGVGLLLAVAPTFPVFLTGRYSTMRGALITIAATVIAILMVWWTRRDPEREPSWGRLVVLGVLGGLLSSGVVAFAFGADLPSIVRFSWIPLLRAIPVAVGMCLMLSTLAGPVPVLPADGNYETPMQPRPHSLPKPS
jgi:hypothetical protein